jgi:hypothetical protein
LKLHRNLSFVIAGAMALASALFLGTTAEAQEAVQIQINGSPVNVSPAPTIQNGRVFVPLRGVFESLGASVVYSNGQIDATGNGREISLHIGSTQATVDGNAETIDVAPFIIGASTYVPLRFVSQALGASVDWDNTNRIVAITMQGAPQPPPQSQSYGDNGYGDNGYDVDTPPPAIPDYEPPPVPDPNYIWTPGYWAWGPGGYYWVPGTWVPAPQPGLVWTPGYWAYQNGYYGWNNGYWAPTVGYYGGVYYGGGYYGHGYGGGRWSGNTYQYNTAVVRITVGIISAVYVDRAVIVTSPARRVAYNGGPGGLATRPTQTELSVAHAKHVPPTSAQQQHVQVASQDRGLLATVNSGKPPVVSVAHPFTPAAKPAGFVPVTSADTAVAQKHIVRPAAHPAVAAPVKTAAPREGVERPVPVKTAPPVVHPEARPVAPTPAPVRPTRRPAIVRPTPARAAPVPTAAIRPLLARPTAAPRPVPVRPVATPPPAAPRPPAEQTAAPRPPVVHTPPPRPRPTPLPKPEKTETPQ